MANDKHLTRGQQTVLRALSFFNKIDDIGLAVYVHHVAGSDMSSSGVRTRRRELERKGLVAIKGIKRTKSGRNAAEHGLTSQGKKRLKKLDKKAVLA